MTLNSNAGQMDRQDERLSNDKSMLGKWKGLTEKVRGGDLGQLPVLFGLVIIAVIFQSINPFFLSSANLVNLLMQSAAVGVIALGIVIILLVGEIDLSVGSVSGLAASAFAVTLTTRGFPIIASLLLAISIGIAIGALYGVIFNRVGLPSFVISLAGLLGFVGFQLWVLGKAGTINLPFESAIVRFGQLAFIPEPISYLICALVGLGYFLSRSRESSSRKKVNLSFNSVISIAVKSISLSLVLIFVAWYLNKDRGVGWMFLLFVGLVLLMNHLLNTTAWGRSIYAVGGNVEAARRSGINVKRVYMSAFVLCSTFAAIGGLLAAGRLASAAQSSGGGDVNLNAIAAAVIGGTSLFGGRGTAFSALLGIIVIQSISSGLTLLNLDSDVRYMITGLVLLIAVSLDAIARKSRTSKGKA
jgi:simple sugar transport system permease protein/D-xylose transport system permease protein